MKNYCVIYVSFCKTVATLFVLCMNVIFGRLQNDIEFEE